ncbi:Neuronal acetylcholine receptor subunit alpha-7 [Harpegnathos saltator]|uniref:Neuronal acetylcholine receptor subunit alpha-7 n=1 Tax=Harpegnathos saltator TaxID=610380 RepID=E2BYQ5_HARSA|nr:Neuronal acetylcholine receptor subunit alpha-7 [Harpegnathos saltator]
MPGQIGRSRIAIRMKRLVSGGYHEKRLLNDLLDAYNVLERPVGNESDPLVLSFGLTLMQIIDVLLATVSSRRTFERLDSMAWQLLKYVTSLCDSRDTRIVEYQVAQDSNNFGASVIRE